MFSACWIVGSDVATTCTSRIAMNMPTHIMAKPVHVEIDTGFEAWRGAGIIPAPKCFTRVLRRAC